MNISQLVWRESGQLGCRLVPWLASAGLLLLAGGCGQSEPPQKVVDQAVRWELFKNHLAPSPGQQIEGAPLSYEITHTTKEGQNGEAVFVYAYEARVPVRVDESVQTIGEPEERPDGKFWLVQTNRNLAEEDEEEGWTLTCISGTVTIYKNGKDWAFKETRR